MLQCLQIFVSYVRKIDDFKTLFVVSWCTLLKFLVLSFCNICVSYLILLSIETLDVNICYLFLYLNNIDYCLPHTHLSNFLKFSTKKRFKEIMKFLTIYVEFENCKLVVFASTHIIMSFACKGGLTLCDVLKFFSRPFPLTLCNVVEIFFQPLPSTLQRKTNSLPKN